MCKFTSFYLFCQSFLNIKISEQNPSRRAKSGRGFEGEGNFLPASRKRSPAAPRVCEAGRHHRRRAAGRSDWIFLEILAKIVSNGVVKPSCFVVVRVEGIEPSASVLSGQRSTTELHSQNLFLDQSDFFQSFKIYSYRLLISN